MYSTLRRGRTSESTADFHSPIGTGSGADIAPTHDGRNTGVRVRPSKDAAGAARGLRRLQPARWRAAGTGDNAVGHG